jgi:hypothetical protein
MGFTVVHQPSYTLVGGLAAEAARQKEAQELAKQWAELHLKNRQLGLQRQELAQRAAMQQQEMAMKAALAERQMQFEWAKMIADNMRAIGLAQIQHLRDLQAIDLDFRNKLILHGKEWDARNALEEKRNELERNLKMLDFENQRKLEEFRAGLERGKMDRASLLSAEKDANEIYDVISRLPYNDEGQKLFASLEEELRNIAKLPGGDAVKAQAYREWITKALQLNKPMYQAPPSTLMEEFNRNIVYHPDIGMWFQRNHKGEWQALIPGRYSDIQRNNQQAQNFFDPNTEEVYTYDYSGRRITIIPPKAERRARILDRLKGTPQLTIAQAQAQSSDPQAVEKLIDSYEQILYGDILNQYRSGAAATGPVVVPGPGGAPAPGTAPGAAPGTPAGSTAPSGTTMAPPSPAVSDTIDKVVSAIGSTYNPQDKQYIASRITQGATISKSTTNPYSVNTAGGFLGQPTTNALQSGTITPQDVVHQQLNTYYRAIALRQAFNKNSKFPFELTVPYVRDVFASPQSNFNWFTDLPLLMQDLGFAWAADDKGQIFITMLNAQFEDELQKYLNGQKVDFKNLGYVVFQQNKANVDNMLKFIQSRYPTEAKTAVLALLEILDNQANVAKTMKQLEIEKAKYYQNLPTFEQYWDSKKNYLESIRMLIEQKAKSFGIL